jgi:hypothetical protein
VFTEVLQEIRRDITRGSLDSFKHPACQLSGFRSDKAAHCHLENYCRRARGITDWAKWKNKKPEKKEAAVTQPKQFFVSCYLLLNDFVFGPNNHSEVEAGTNHFIFRDRHLL